MAKQPSVVDARSQTQFILDRTDSLMEMGYIKKKPGRDAIDWTLLEQVIAENQDALRQAQIQVRVRCRWPRAAQPQSTPSAQAAGDQASPGPPSGVAAGKAARSPCSRDLAGPLVSVGAVRRPLGSCCWAFGVADPKLLPPPHIFLGNIAEQAKFFNTARAGRSASGRTPARARSRRCSITVAARHCAWCSRGC